MDGADHWSWAAGVFFLLGSAFFSATDAALVTLGEMRSRQLVDAGGARGRLLSIWVKHPDRVNATLTVGATLVATGMGALFALGSRDRSPGALATTALLAGGLLLVVGQLIPRVLGKRFPARTAVVSIPVVHVLYWMLWPLV
ncbi:MAG: CNNM domain-containing protein, partial [Myxococcales bacterium]